MATMLKIFKDGLARLGDWRAANEWSHQNAEAGAYGSDLRAAHAARNTAKGR